MVLEIHTDYDVAHLEELQRVLNAAVNPGAVEKTKKTCILIGGAMLVASVILLLISEKPLVSTAVTAVLGFFCMERGVNIFKHSAKSIRRKMNPGFTGNDYILDELGLRIENVTGVMEYTYEDCERLLETDKNVYIFLKDGQGLILDKNNLEGGSVEQLRTWLEENCGKKLEWVKISGK